MDILSKVQSYFLLAAEQNKLAHCWIPEIWNQNGYESVLAKREQQVAINPFAFTAALLNQLQSSEGALDERSLDESIIYASLVRYTAAWDYDGSGCYQSGTFLRMVWLLPMLQKMGVNILYLLPVTRNSELNRKGDLGSPYAIADYFSLDPALHDPLFDGLEGFTLDDELALLIAVCHRMGIQVVHDFIPRVTGMDNELVKLHPEWIYWLRREALPGFAPPEVPALPRFTECSSENLGLLYQSPATGEHLDRFSLPPSELDNELWLRLKAQAETDGCELLALVEEQMGIVPAPAHSDWINDDQPVWTDITFLRLYLDAHPQAPVSHGQPPYVLFDTIKCNRFPANQPNEALWSYLEEAVSFQMRRYGFDGFRIDIGHTLPPALLQRLIARMHECSGEPLIISEDLFNRNHERARDTGYNIMLGSGWNVMADLSHESLSRYLRELAELKIHAFACSETPDTPRITSREGGKQLARMLALFNGFLPNAIPFINTGLEVNELQPLNCGLADNTGGASIPKAFFNRMQIGWQHNHGMFELLCQIAVGRQRFRHLLRPQQFFLHMTSGPLLHFGYRHGHEALHLLCNIDRTDPVVLDRDLLGVGAEGTVTLLLDSRSQEYGSAGQWPAQVAPQQAVLLWQTTEILGGN
jgi:starch synthase (maltosyl-transferring)